jgi:hypothetical protein
MQANNETSSNLPVLARPLDLTKVMQQFLDKRLTSILNCPPFFIRDYDRRSDIVYIITVSDDPETKKSHDRREYIVDLTVSNNFVDRHFSSIQKLVLIWLNTVYPFIRFVNIHILPQKRDSV